MELNIQDLTLSLPHNGHAHPILKGLNLTISRGKTLALLGESGSGKSFTALSLMQLLPQDAHFSRSSHILLDGQDLIDFPEVLLRSIRGQRLAMVFQEPMTSLNPVLTVGRQIKEAILKSSPHSKRAYARTLELMTAVGLNEPSVLYHQYPHQLSGGMKQRIMIAIALAGDPDLLIADEATSALDVTIQQQILDLLQKLQAERGMGLLLITHDLAITYGRADEIAILYAGFLVEKAPAKVFFQGPRHPYSQLLLASIPRIAATSARLAVIPGMIPAWTEPLPPCPFATRCPYAWEPCHTIIPQFLEVAPQHFAQCHLNDPRYGSQRLQEAFVMPAQAEPHREMSSLDAYLRRHDKTSELVEKLPALARENCLVVKDLKVYFPIHKGILKQRVAWFKAVDGISFSLPKGKTLAIVGGSGSGKSTLAKAILQLLPVYAGQVQLGAKTFPSNHSEDIYFLRRNAQIIFQDPYSSMNPRLLIANILAEGLEPLKLSLADQEKRMLELLAQVNLPAESLQRYPHEFSGGQRQRLCIARALAMQPQLLILDEPTSALDISVQAKILNLLKELQEKFQLTYLLITHNIGVVHYMANEVLVMQNGCLVEQGAVEDIINHPQHPYTRELIAAVPKMG